jgi:ubiquinone biosynthesis protein
MSPHHVVEADPERTSPAGGPAARLPAGPADARGGRPPDLVPGPKHGFHPLASYRGLFRRFFVVHRHLLALLAGGLVAHVRALPPARRRGLRSGGVRLVAWLVRPLLDPAVARLPFPRQLRRRLEMLGPTYVKLGQIMAVREDLLPTAVCTELQNLFERVPPFPFPQVRALLEQSLQRPVELEFASIDPHPIGSASIAQAHRAETLDGRQVVIKVMRPGIREVIEYDLRLLRILGILLQWIVPRYQPRQIVREFGAYTIREVDFTFEADNAETFAANFRDVPEVVFPRIDRELSSSTVLTMEFLDGFKPGTPQSLALAAADRARIIDVGAGAIIRMLYRDGFFHADLHAGNLLILPGVDGGPARVGFIDLGMVGRFEERTRRRMLYYYHALVTGDVGGAARFLAEMATVGPGGDPHGFARAVEDLSRRFVTRAVRGRFSIAQLILESVGLGGRYRVFFPVEMTLMVKALVTFEGVGRMLEPELDVTEISRRHVAEVFRAHFSLHNLARSWLRGTPELVDLAGRVPELLTAGVRFLEETVSQRSPASPLAGVRSSILAAACIVGGVIALVSSGPLHLALALFALALALTLWGR